MHYIDRNGQVFVLHSTYKGLHFKEGRPYVIIVDWYLSWSKWQDGSRPRVKIFLSFQLFKNISENSTFILPLKIDNDDYTTIIIIMAILYIMMMMMTTILQWWWLLYYSHDDSDDWLYYYHDNDDDDNDYTIIIILDTNAFVFLFFFFDHQSSFSSCFPAKSTKLYLNQSVYFSCVKS